MRAPATRASNTVAIAIARSSSRDSSALAQRRNHPRSRTKPSSSAAQACSTAGSPSQRSSGGGSAGGPRRRSAAPIPPRSAPSARGPSTGRSGGASSYGGSRGSARAPGHLSGRSSSSSFTPDRSRRSMSTQRRTVRCISPAGKAPAQWGACRRWRTSCRAATPGLAPVWRSRSQPPRSFANASVPSSTFSAHAAASCGIGMPASSRACWAASHAALLVASAGCRAAERAASISARLSRERMNGSWRNTATAGSAPCRPASPGGRTSGRCGKSNTSCAAPGSMARARARARKSRKEESRAMRPGRRGSSACAFCSASLTSANPSLLAASLCVRRISRSEVSRGSPAARRWRARASAAARRAASSRRSGSSRSTSRCLLDQPRLASPPVEVLEVRVHVLAPLGGLVVGNEGVLPGVHHHDGFEARRVAVLVERDPVVRHLPVLRVLIGDGPAHPAHAGDGLEVVQPGLEAAETLRQRLRERPRLVQPIRLRPDTPEVELVQHHPAVLEPETAGHLRKGRIGGFCFSFLQDPVQLSRELVHVLHVALVQLEVILQQRVRNARETLQPGKLLRFVPFHTAQDAHGLESVRRALAPFVGSRSTERSRNASVRAGKFPREGGMDPNVSEWLNLVFRWIHVLAGVMWIGHLWFFNFVNAQVAKTYDPDSRKKVVPELMPRGL